MAYRRKNGTPRASTFEDFHPNFAAAVGGSDSPTSTPSLAAQAIYASAVHRNQPLSSTNQRSVSFNQAPVRHEYASMRSMNERNANETKFGFWGVLVRKAKSILEDDNDSQQFNDHGRNESQMPDTSMHLQEGLTTIENRTADIIQENKGLQTRKKSVGLNPRSQVADISAPDNLSQYLSDQENQLKASRDLANAMTAKAKLLLREVKTVKADLAFAKERCNQLEEENKLLRESREKGEDAEDDDLIRLQLETLLAEKGRLAHENSIYTRENRFLREIVEYHQLTMHDVVYLDGVIEDVDEDDTIQISSPCSSSQSASETLSSAIMSPQTLVVPKSPSPKTEVEPDSPSSAARIPLEECYEESSNSSPKSEESPKKKHSPSSP